MINVLKININKIKSKLWDFNINKPPYKINPSWIKWILILIDKTINELIKARIVTLLNKIELSRLLVTAVHKISIIIEYSNIIEFSNRVSIFLKILIELQ